MEQKLTIEDFASKHLGKTSDGKTMTRYETPTKISPEVLVGVPRSFNRDYLKLKDGEFVGYDVWKGYELSTIRLNGMPISFMATISYSASTVNIVESKSIKLYFNSYNGSSELESKLIDSGFTRDQITTRSILDAVELLAAEHLSKIVQAPVTVIAITHQALMSGILQNGTNLLSHPPHDYLCIDDASDIMCPTYIEDPSLLKSTVDWEIDDNVPYVRLTSTLLRSNCRITNQPDWGFVYLVIDKTAKINLASIIQYIVSLRNNNSFHEEVAEKAFKRISDFIGNDKKLGIGITYSRRGGFDINPIRVSHVNLLNEFAWIDDFSRTTMQ